MRVCHCNKDIVKTASGSGTREELELEYVSKSSKEEEEYRTPPPDLMMMVIKERTPHGMFPVTIKVDNDD